MLKGGRKTAAKHTASTHNEERDHAWVLLLDAMAGVAAVVPVDLLVVDGGGVAGVAEQHADQLTTAIWYMTLAL